MTDSTSTGATRRAMSDAPLWTGEDHGSRLAELAARTSDPAKDAPLRLDVRSLGTLLGRVLVEQGGNELFTAVEQLSGTSARGAHPNASSARTWAPSQSAEVCVSVASAYSFALYGQTATNSHARCSSPVVRSVKNAGSPA